MSTAYITKNYWKSAILNVFNIFQSYLEFGFYKVNTLKPTKELMIQFILFHYRSLFS